MEKIKILTPVHVGDGSTYYVADVKDNYVYTLDNVISIMNEKDITSDSITKILMRSKNLSRKEFIEKFKFDRSKLKPEISYCKVKNNNSYLLGNVFSQLKENDKLVIPGSSIKGYVLNVIYFDIIQNNNVIRTYLENKFNYIYNKYKDNFEKNFKYADKEVQNVIKHFLNEANFIMNTIGFRDLYFESETEYVKVRRYNNANNLDMQTHEVIPADAHSNCQIYFDLFELSKGHTDKVKNELKKEIFKLKKDDDNTKQVKQLLVDEIYNRISIFNDWFIPSNRKFMNRILQLEMDYADKVTNPNVDSIGLIKILSDIKELNKNKIIMQIGKGTNFVVKSIGLAFTNTYDKYFNIIFSPSSGIYKNIKRKSGITMLPLIESNSRGTIPLGFISVDL